MENNKELRPAPKHYQELVNRIVKLSGMKHTLFVFETETDKRFLTHNDNGIPIVGYDPMFISEHKSAVKWAEVALFASEVIYHHNVDLHGKYICNYYNIRTVPKTKRKRINEDFFVGKVLRHEGATMEEALDVLSYFGKFQSEEIRAEREELVINGWKSADEQLNVPALAPIKQETSTNTTLAAMLLGLILMLIKE